MAIHNLFSWNRRVRPNGVPSRVWAVAGAKTTSTARATSNEGGVERVGEIDCVLYLLLEKKNSSLLQERNCDEQFVD